MTIIKGGKKKSKSKRSSLLKLTLLNKYKKKQQKSSSQNELKNLRKLQKIEDKKMQPHIDHAFHTLPLSPPSSQSRFQEQPKPSTNTSIPSTQTMNYMPFTEIFSQPSTTPSNEEIAKSKFLNRSQNTPRDSNLPRSYKYQKNVSERKQKNQQPKTSAPSSSQSWFQEQPNPSAKGGKKRKSVKRKSVKRKSTKRKSTKRKSVKRKSPKRKSTKRKSPKRKSTKRKSTKRKSKSNSKLGCVDLCKYGTASQQKKYCNRNSPPFPAAVCNELGINKLKGNDRNMYYINSANRWSKE